MERGEVISEWSSERMTPGGGGRLGDEGNMSQYFAPVSTAFHALVALGSLWKVLAEDFEEVVAEGGGSPVCGVWSCAAGGYARLFDEGAVEDVEGAFVLAVRHVVDVLGHRPIDGFSAKFHIGVLL
jgi:hypothetical protein